VRRWKSVALAGLLTLVLLGGLRADGYSGCAAAGLATGVRDFVHYFDGLESASPEISGWQRVMWSIVLTGAKRLQAEPADHPTPSA